MRQPRFPLPRRGTCLLAQHLQKLLQTLPLRPFHHWHQALDQCFLLRGTDIVCGKLALQPRKLLHEFGVALALQSADHILISPCAASADAELLRDLSRHRFIDIHSFSLLSMLVPTLILQIVSASLRLIFSARCRTLLLREAVRAGTPAPCLSEAASPKRSHSVINLCTKRTKFSYDNQERD